jgi:hypothetical protein
MSKRQRESMLGADFPFLPYFGMLLAFAGLAMLSTESGWLAANDIYAFLDAK